MKGNKKARELENDIKNNVKETCKDTEHKRHREWWEKSNNLILPQENCIWKKEKNRTLPQSLLKQVQELLESKWTSSGQGKIAKDSREPNDATNAVGNADDAAGNVEQESNVIHKHLTHEEPYLLICFGLYWYSTNILYIKFPWMKRRRMSRVRLKCANVFGNSKLIC